MWYWILLAAVGAGRLLELVLSRRNRARMVSEKGAEPGKDAIFPLMVILHSMPFWLIPLEVLFFDRGFQPRVGYPMLLIFALATVLRFWVLATLRGYWNAQIMVPPDLDPVTTGPYRYIRHPNYLVVIAELFSLPLVYSCYWSALILSLLNGIVLRYRIRDEERLLFASPRYAALMGHKPRFVPRTWR